MRGEANQGRDLLPWLAPPLRSTLEYVDRLLQPLEQPELMTSTYLFTMAGSGQYPIVAQVNANNVLFQMELDTYH